MKSDIISLNDVYENNEMFYWTNCMGEINMPGDPKGKIIIHRKEELPESARSVYAQTEFGAGLRNYVVSFHGKVGFLISVLIDESWLQDVLEKDDVDAESEELLRWLPDIVGRIQDKMEQDFGIQSSRYSVLIGKNTDPDGHELMFFVEQPFANTYKKLIQYLDSRIYNMLRRELQRIEIQKLWMRCD